jgi:hypothetical protein
MSELFDKICRVITEYETLGLPKSYLRLLQSRLAQTILTSNAHPMDSLTLF